MPDSPEYLQKIAFFNRILTVYGRKPVLEALRDPQLQCHALHLANSNREGSLIRELREAAEHRAIAVKRHTRAELARISKNGKQDQGVALDIVCPAFRALEDYLANLEQSNRRQRLLALDGISNPQNLGMIIRSAVAGDIDGILWSPQGNAALGPLVIKASAGTLYRAPLLITKSLVPSLVACQNAGIVVCTLEAQADESLFSQPSEGHCLYILGNESEGVSREVSQLADRRLSIPMRGQVESLNVAVTAALIAYAGYLDR